MIRIVLIEDESLVAKDIQSRLRRAGYDIVGIASRGEDGIAKVDELLPDVVLMDIALKGEIDGVEAAQQIIERFDIPVIYLTVHTDAATVRRATATASYGFIVKPFGELELLAAIEMAVYKHGIEVKARESDKRISEISDALEEIIYETDVKGAFTFVNAACLTMFGYTREELEAGLTIFDIMVPDERSEAREVFKRRIDGEKIGRIEHTGLRNDGSTFPIAVRATTIERDGAVVGTRGIILDVTALKRAEDELREREEMLRLVLDTSNDAIGLVDVDGVFLLANEALARRFGVKPAEVTGKKGFAEKPEEVAKLRRAHFARAIATKLPVHFDDEHAGRGLENSYHPIVAHDGSITRVAVFSRDVTERKHLEEEAQSAERFPSENPYPVLRLSGDGRVLFTNKAASTLLGAYEDTRAERVLSRLYSAAADAIEAKSISQIEVDVSGRTYKFSVVPIVEQGYVNFYGADITERRNAEKELKESEHKYRTLVETANSIICTVDIEGTIQFINDFGAHFFGYTVDELIGQNIMIIVPDWESTGRDLTHHIADVIAHPDKHAVSVNENVTKDGQRVWVNWVNTRFNDAEGRHIGHLTVGTDVTEQGRLEDALTHERDQAQLYLDTADVIMVALNREGRITLLNRKGCELLGVTPEQAVGTDWFETFLPEDVRTETWGVFETLIGGDPETHRNVESTVVTSRGEERIVAWQNSLLNDDKGDVIGTLSSGTDVTERVRADQRLRKSEQQHRHFLDVLQEGIWVIDKDSNTTLANPRMAEMLGYTVEEMSGKHLFSFMDERGVALAEYLLERRQRGIREEHDFEFMRKDGSRIYAQLETTPLLNDAGEYEGAIAAVSDITKRKQLEEELAWESAINSTIANLFTPLIAPTSTIEDIALAILNEAKLLTGSEHGFVSLIDPVNRDMVAFGLTQMMLSECAIPEEKRQIRFPLGADGSYPSLWGYALNTKKGFFTNAPATHPGAQGTPDGHTPLTQFLAAPVLIGEEVVGQIALANPGRDYTKRDLMAVERLADVYALAVVRTQEEDEIKASLKERETLLKEIHHRVKNNMQIISSLLSLQAAHATERETIEMLDESQGRIRSMALIHETLYRSDSLAEIDFGDYVESFIEELLRMYNVPLGVITITADIKNVQLGVDTAIPCALIINELVSNSLKYAFPDGHTGDVTVSLQRANGAHTLTVADNGVGFPADMDFRTTDSLGMQLVVTLVNQLDGTITLDRTKGTTFIITFKPEGTQAPSTRHL